MRAHTASELFTDLIAIGTREDIDHLRALAGASDRLVRMSTPQPAGPQDPRLRIVIRLRPTP